MTTYIIEVRAITGQYDILAQQVARELLQLFDTGGPQSLPYHPTHNQQSPYNVRTAQLYHLTGDLSLPTIEQLTNHLLIDTVTQQASISQTSPTLQAEHIIDVYFHPGVTDTLAESVLTGASMLGITGLTQVETGHRYFLDSRLAENEVRLITESLLYNPVIQQYTPHFVGTRFIMPFRLPEPQARTQSVWESDSRNTDPASTPNTLHEPNVGAQFIAPSNASRDTSVTLHDSHQDAINRVPTSTMTDEQLLALSKQGLLALNLEEMRTIQQHYREEGREPTDVELETLAQTWSEHCSHKTFKATIDYREVDSNGHILVQETIPGLLKHYIMQATQQVAHPWIVSAFSDNAGIIRFTKTQDIAFKVETHNHPSAIEPFGGANTGVGGVIRDVLGVSGQPIACTDILCFGPPDTPSQDLPPGILSPRRIASGVVNGVRDYGNKMGIPTVNGAILYHPGYIYNPLVFCGCLGMLPHGSHPRRVQPGDRIVVLGGRTGRDGIHGATFSSGEMSSEINAQAGSAVQIGAPITEKKVADAIIQARDRQLYSAITDCGAGGFSSAIGEMAAETGAYVELEKAPLKYQGLTPWEIWLSEAQERMVLAVPPSHLQALLDICAIEEVEATIIGTFTDSHRLHVTYHSQIVADIDMTFLHNGRPGRTMDAVWIHPDSHPRATARVAPTMTTDNESQRGIVGATLALALSNPTLSTPALSLPASFTHALLTLLRHPTIASKESVVRRYDHEIQGATVLKPLVGRAGNGPGDAAVLHPILDEQTNAAIVLSNGINPLYGEIDPYWMAMNAVDEALRNLTAVGGDIERTAILDNFCWGNPTDPAQLGLLVRAVKGCHDAATGFGTPFISGKDSLNNEYRANGQRLPVIPTLLISAVSVIDNATQTIDMSLKHPGNLLYLIGITRNELAGSHYIEIVSVSDNTSRSHSKGGGGVDEGRRPLRSPSPGYNRYIPNTTVPHVDVPTARSTMQAIGQAIRSGLVQSCHDLSEGGLAVAAAEMSLAGLLGLSIDTERVPHLPDELMHQPPDIRNTILLFSESASRFLVEVSPEQKEAFEDHMRAHALDAVACIGSVTDTGHFEVHSGEQHLIDLPVSDLQAAWKGEQA